MIVPIEIKIKTSDTQKTKSYKYLLAKQLDWCQKHEDILISHANRTYEIVTKYPEKSKHFTKRCCDFKKLEKVLEKWLDKSQNVDKDTQERSAKRPLTVSKPSKDSYKRLRESFNAGRKKNEAEKPMPKRNKGKDDHDL